MNPETVVREFWRLMGTNDFPAVKVVLAEDFVLEWPQSKERIRGADNFASMNAEYEAHGPWSFRVNRLVASGNEVVTQVSVTDGVQRAEPISFFTVVSGRITRLVEYWPDPTAALPNRSHLVERMEAHHASATEKPAVLSSPLVPRAKSFQEGVLVSPRMRSVLAVVVGAVVGGMVNMSLIWLSPSLIPPPDGVNVTTPEGLKAGIHLFETKHFIMPFLAHALGTFVGALVAFKLAVTNKVRAAYIVGALFLVGGIAASMMIPAPAWFIALDLLVAYLPMAWLAIMVGGSSASHA